MPVYNGGGLFACALLMIAVHSPGQHDPPLTQLYSPARAHMCVCWKRRLAQQGLGARGAGLDGVYCDEPFHELEQAILMDADAELEGPPPRASRRRSPAISAVSPWRASRQVPHLPATARVTAPTHILDWTGNAAEMLLRSIE